MTQGKGCWRVVAGASCMLAMQSGRFHPQCRERVKLGSVLFGQNIGQLFLSICDKTRLVYTNFMVLESEQKRKPWYKPESLPWLCPMH